MKIFVSWSKDLSKNIAIRTCQFIKSVIQIANPWMSTETDKGIGWLEKINTELKESKFGVIVLTSDNLTSSWLQFESGVIFGKLEKTKICPILFNINKSDVEFPLSQFQLTSFEKDDFLVFFKSLLNEINQSETKIELSIVEKSFNAFWNDYELDIKKLLKNSSNIPQKRRTDNDLLVEILTIVRAISNQSIKNSYVDKLLSAKMIQPSDNNMSTLLTKYLVNNLLVDMETNKNFNNDLDSGVDLKRIGEKDEDKK